MRSFYKGCYIDYILTEMIYIYTHARKDTAFNKSRLRTILKLKNKHEFKGAKRKNNKPLRLRTILTQINTDGG